MRKEKPPEDVALFSKLNCDQYLKCQVPRIWEPGAGLFAHRKRLYASLEQLGAAKPLTALLQPHSQRQMDLLLFSVSFWALAVGGSAQNPCQSEGDLLLGLTA